MKWRLYKKDDPNTWPQIDCPMVVWTGEQIFLCDWYNDERKMFDLLEVVDADYGYDFNRLTEFYYAYIGHIPSGYKTCHPIICTCKDCPEGYDDNGYCMDYDNDYICGFKKEVAEYTIEEKRIWKEFK